ncbi:MAG: hypothetical protein CUN55_08555 [Phototrophicales bacterium]|nr:MAG: hypothetical protein CUN55_08555 [Phototrophicales bacterium]
MKYIAEVGNQTYEIEVQKNDQVIVNGEPRNVDFHVNSSHGVFSLLLDHQSYEVVVDEQQGTYKVLIAGHLYEVSVVDERSKRLAEAAGGIQGGAGDSSVRSPMPGLIVAVPVEEGQEVTAGTTVVILESMKMQNELKAPVSGVVSKINVSAGDNVEQNKVLIVIHSED